jgi:hypothetical protein
VVCQIHNVEPLSGRSRMSLTQKSAAKPPNRIVQHVPKYVMMAISAVARANK